MQSVRGASPAAPRVSPPASSRQTAIARAVQPPARYAPAAGLRSEATQSAPPARSQPCLHERSCRCQIRCTHSSIPMTRRFRHSSPWSSLMMLGAGESPTPNHRHHQFEGRPLASKPRAKRAIISAVASERLIRGAGPLPHLRDKRCSDAQRFFLRLLFLPLRFGTFLPFLRASESPIAIACLRLLTFFPLRPLLSVPRLRLRMLRSTSLDALREYRRAMMESFPVARGRMLPSPDSPH